MVATFRGTLAPTGSFFVLRACPTDKTSNLSMSSFEKCRFIATTLLDTIRLFIKGRSGAGSKRLPRRCPIPDAVLPRLRYSSSFRLPQSQFLQIAHLDCS